jgi:cytochrome c-type biogenesis protein CcmH/NrfG
MLPHALLVALLLTAGSHDPAGKLAELHAQIRREPGRAELYVQRAECYSALRLREKARADYEAALRLAPANVDARLGAAGLD